MYFSGFLIVYYLFVPAYEILILIVSPTSEGYAESAHPPSLPAAFTTHRDIDKGSDQNLGIKSHLLAVHVCTQIQ